MTAKDELKRVLVICEAGVNHNGSLDRAMGLVDAAARAGADVVKFQTFKPEQIVTVAAPKAAYQDRNAPEYRSQLEMLKALELDADAHRALLQHCRTRGIQFLSTPFDTLSVALLAGSLGLTLLKVSSGDLTNAPLLLRMAQSGASLILSTGMATMDEIEEALGVVAFGYLGGAAPNRAAFKAAWGSEAGGSLAAEAGRRFQAAAAMAAPQSTPRARVRRMQGILARRPPGRRFSAVSRGQRPGSAPGAWPRTSPCRQRRATHREPDRRAGVRRRPSRC